MPYKSSTRTLVKVRDSQEDIVQIKAEFSDVSTKVDAVEKSISNEVWKDTVINIVDEEGNVVDTKSIESLLVSNSISLGGLKSEVQDVKTYVGEAPDDGDKSTLTERITLNTQTATSIKSQVEYISTYEIDSKIEKSQNSIINQMADVIAQTVENKIDGTGSYVNQRAEQIEHVVGKKLFEPVKMRFVRDWLYSNDKDEENRFVECQVINHHGVNVASGIIPTAYDNDLTELTNISNLEIYTNEAINNNYIYNNNCSMLQIDLGSVQDEIDTIKVWHYFVDDRTCESKLEISEDGINWITIFDSTVDGHYVETSLGYENTVQSQSLLDQISFLKQTINSFNLTVQRNNDSYSSLLVNQQTISQRIQNMEDNISSYTEQITDANGWKLYMKQIGAYYGEDVDSIETCIDMNPEEGISVTSSEKKGYKTSLKPDELVGYYNPGTLEGNGETVFSVRGDLTYSKRFKTDTGVDFGSMKVIPIKYNNPVKNNAFNILSFVKGGGDS